LAKPLADGKGGMAAPKGDFYCRYYVGHKGKFGHEFLEFEFTAGGQVCLLFVFICDAVSLCFAWRQRNLSVQMRYANNSNYKNDTMIRKEAHVSKTVVDELRRILVDSEVDPPLCCDCNDQCIKCLTEGCLAVDIEGG